MDEELKSLLNKKEAEKKKKNYDKVKGLEIELVKIKSSNKPDKLQNALKELNKIQVVDKKLHEIKNEILLDYTGEIKKVGSSKVGDQICQIHIRFRKTTEYEAYINFIDEGYDARCYFQ